MSSLIKNESWGIEEDHYQALQSMSLTGIASPFSSGYTIKLRGRPKALSTNLPWKHR
jgi:hypothetical protein